MTRLSLENFIDIVGEMIWLINTSCTWYYFCCWVFCVTTDLFYGVFTLFLFFFSLSVLPKLDDEVLYNYLYNFRTWLKSRFPVFWSGYVC